MIALVLGIAASKNTESNPGRPKSIATHTVFGVGIYMCVLSVSATYCAYA